MPKIPHVKPGDPITAEAFNAVAEKLERCLNLTVAPGSGLVMQEGPWGKALALCLPHHIWGKLTGSSSPYDWVEVRADTSGAWATFGNRGKAANAYEINSKAGLNGKVVQLWWTAAGDMRFVYEGVGGVCDWVFTFVGCTGGGVSGVSVVLTQGATTIATGTTNGSGVVTFSALPVGTYTITATAGNGFAVFTQSRTHACVGSSPENVPAITLSADSTHVCTTCCNYPIPKTLYTTDSNGTHALNWVSGASWQSDLIDSGFAAYKASDGFVCCLDDGTCHYRIVFSCDALNQWHLAVSVGTVGCGMPGGSSTSCLNGVQTVQYANAPGGAGPEALSSGGTCAPVSLTFSMPTTFSVDTATLATPGGGGTMVVTP